MLTKKAALKSNAKNLTLVLGLLNQDVTKKKLNNDTKNFTLVIAYAGTYKFSMQL